MLRLNGTNCGNAPTGTITFFAGSTQLGTPQTLQPSTNPTTCQLNGSVYVTTSALTFWAKHDYCEVQRRCQLRRYHFCAGLNIHRDHYHQRHQHLGLDDSAGTKRHLHCDRDPESSRRPGTHRHRAIHRERHRHRQRRGAQRRKSASGHDFLASVPARIQLQLCIPATPIMSLP